MVDDGLALQAALETVVDYHNPSDHMAAKEIALAAIERYCELVDLASRPG